MRLVAALAVAIALAAGGWFYGQHRYGEGRADEKAVWVAASEKEDARQAAVNAAALRLQRQAIAELQKRNDTLSALLEANDEQARKDPRANSAAIGRDSVRRLNAVR
jgi:uncharacterized protein HemX